jgi:hypothetical protein
VFKITLTENELRYFYWRMKTNRWYERYTFASKRDNPWQEWMAETIDKLEPIYKTLDE